MAYTTIPPLDDVLKDLKSLILSAPRNITAKELFQDYFEMTQVKLNPRNYQFKSEDDFIGAFPQFFYAVNVIKGQIHYAGISNNPSTNAVAELVNNQRNSGKKANICVNGSNLQRSNTLNAGNKFGHNIETTPAKTVPDSSKPSYADFFKTPQPKLDQQSNYEPSVTISMGSDVLSKAKLGRSQSVRGAKKSASHIVPPPKSTYNDNIHKNFNNLNIKSSSAKNSTLNTISSFNGKDLRSIIEGNKSYNSKLKATTNTVRTPIHTVPPSPSVTPKCTNAAYNNDRKKNHFSVSNSHSIENIPPSTTFKQNAPRQQKQTDGIAAENRELYDFVQDLRANVKKCLELHRDRFCSLSQLQDDYIELFGEPFHPAEMPKSDITNIFETYLGNVCMVLNNMKGVLYIKGLVGDQ